MSIKYNVIERGEPGVVGGGIKKWYASVVSDGEITIDNLTQEIEKFSALSEADIRGVIIALENVITSQILNGKTVRLDQLGSFSPALSSDGTATKAEFTSSFIKRGKIHYRPSVRITSSLKTAKFVKTK